MELKCYRGKILLHLVDHATRLSASSVIHLKILVSLSSTSSKYVLKSMAQLETFSQITVESLKIKNSWNV